MRRIFGAALRWQALSIAIFAATTALVFAQNRVQPPPRVEPIRPPQATRESSTAPGAPAVQDSGTAPDPHLFTSDFVPPTGAGSPPNGGGSGGPWSSRIKLASSPDGIAFTATGEAVTDQGGVPNAVVGHDGLLRIYYNAWFNTARGGVAMAVRSTEGKWFFHKINVATSLNLKTIADPSVIVQADGTYRLYFMLEADRIVTASSKNSYDFTVDQESALNPEDPLFDPTVLQVDVGYVMLTGPDGQFYATSSDGLAFTEQTPLTFNGSRFHAWSGTRLANKAGYRLYGYVVGEQKMATMFSQTGAVWAADKSVTIAETNGDSRTMAGADVGVTLMPDGTYTMAYLEPIDPDDRPN